MKTVVDNWEVEKKVGDLVIESLTKRFDVSCKIERQGALVCSLATKSPYGKPREVIIRIPSDSIDNHGYLQALVDTGVRKLINNNYDRF